MAAAIVLAGSIGRERSEISSSLAAIEAIGGPVPDEMRDGLRPALRRPRHAARPRRGPPAWPGRSSGRTGRRTRPSGWTRRATHPAGIPSGSWPPRRSLRSALASLVGGRPVRRRPRASRPCSGALAFGVFGFFLPDLLLHQQGPAPVRADPEGAARQHRPPHDLRGVRSGLRRRAGAGRPQHRWTPGRGVHPRAQGDPDRQRPIGGPARRCPSGPTSTTCGSS